MGKLSDVGTVFNCIFFVHFPVSTCVKEIFQGYVITKTGSVVVKGLEEKVDERYNKGTWSAR